MALIIRSILSFKEEISIILLIVDQDDNLMKSIAIIRKYTNLGLSEIKKRIEMGKPVLEFDLFKDEENDEKVKNIINDLIESGAQIKLFDGEIAINKEVTVEYLMNRIDRYIEIQKQNVKFDDFMYEED